MDIEKALKAGQEYLRDYVFTILAVLTNPRDQGIKGSGTPRDVLPATETRTWMFALISIVLGGLAFTAGTSTKHTSSKITAVEVLLPIFLWTLTAALAHPLCRAFKGRATFVDTFGAFLRIMPTAYLLAGLVAMTFGVLTSGFFKESAAVAKLLAYSIQFAILIVYVPLALAAIHGFGRLGAAVMAVLVPTIALGVNFVGGSGTTQMPMSQAPQPPLRMILEQKPSDDDRAMPMMAPRLASITANETSEFAECLRSVLPKGRRITDTDIHYFAEICRAQENARGMLDRAQVDDNSTRTMTMRRRPIP